jgi:PIN domain nuclease of toxin-antitoxin system
MTILLDAHTFLWFIAGDKRLSAVARSLIEESAHKSVISAATLWEIAIKTSLGRLILTTPFDELITEQLRINGFQILTIEPEHLKRFIDLPFHHRDPFDRLLIAQAMAEEIAIVSVDGALDAYEVKRLW